MKTAIEIYDQLINTNGNCDEISCMGLGGKQEIPCPLQKTIDSQNRCKLGLWDNVDNKKGVIEDLKLERNFYLFFNKL